jgi:hypothetical protein
MKPIPRKVDVPRGDDARIYRLVTDAIAKLRLDLRGQVVLTEAATGHYQLTPIIAALAGADHVLAVARDSRFGTARAISDALLERCRRWALTRAVETIAHDDAALGTADIVTNLGAVRPMDASCLSRLKAGAVISLMWETWEFRGADIDRARCYELKIPLLGTNEHHVDLDIFGYIGMLAIKLLLSAGVEIYRSEIVVAGTGEFASIAVAALRAQNAQVSFFDTSSSAGLSGAKAVLASADALLIIDHHSRRLLIGDGGDLRCEEIAHLNPGLSIAHVCGAVDGAGLVRSGLAVSPARLAPAASMSIATDYVGPRPLIDLHAAGLKVGQAMREATAGGLRGFAAEEWALRTCEYAQGFADRHAMLGKSD